MCKFSVTPTNLMMSVDFRKKEQLTVACMGNEMVTKYTLWMYNVVIAPPWPPPSDLGQCHRITLSHIAMSSVGLDARFLDVQI